VKQFKNENEVKKVPLDEQQHQQAMSSLRQKYISNDFGRSKITLPLIDWLGSVRQVYHFMTDMKTAGFMTNWYWGYQQTYLARVMRVRCASGGLKLTCIMIS
jgi:hypothetical protein